MYQRSERKTSLHTVLLLLAILLPLFWVYSFPAARKLSFLLSQRGYDSLACLVGRGLPSDELSDSELSGLFGFLELSEKGLSKSSDNVTVSWIDGELEENRVTRALDLYAQASQQIAAVTGAVVPEVRVRVNNTAAFAGLSGKYIDSSVHTFDNQSFVYRNVSVLAVRQRLFSWNIPVFYSRWLEEGLALYISARLGKSFDYTLAGNHDVLVEDYYRLDERLNTFKGRIGAFHCVALIDRLSHEKNGIKELLDYLSAGCTFVEALNIVTGLSEPQFAEKWCLSCRETDSYRGLSSIAVFSSIEELIDSGELKLAEASVCSAGANYGKTDLYHFLMGRVIAARSFTGDEELSKDARQLVLKKAIASFNEIGSDSKIYSRAQGEKQKLRDLLARELMEGSEEAHNQSTVSDSSDNLEKKRTSPFLTKVIFSQLLFLGVAGMYYVLKKVVIPLLFILFGWALSSGSIFSSCVALAVTLRVAKILTGYGGYSLWVYLTGSGVSSFTQHLLYIWVSAAILFVLGSLLMESSGGALADNRTGMMAGYVCYSIVIVVMVVVLKFHGYIIWDLDNCTAMGIIHAVVLLLFYGYSHECFFRGGLLKSSETKLHVGSSAVITSLMWALFIVFPIYSMSRLTVAFISGIFFCSLVTSSGSVNSSSGGAAALHFFDWCILGGLMPFGFAVFDMATTSTIVSRLPGAVFSALFWTPMAFSGWCLTLAVFRRTSVSGSPGRTSRLFISSESY